MKAASRLEVSLSKRLFWPCGPRKEALRCHDTLLNLVKKSMLQILFKVILLANINPSKGSCEGDILYKQWSIITAKNFTSYKCHQTDQKCSFQHFPFETDVISLKWKRKKTKFIFQTANILFQMMTSVTFTNRTEHPGLPSNNSVGMSWTHTGWDTLRSSFPEFLMLRMLTLDTENLGVYKVHHTEFVRC